MHIYAGPAAWPAQSMHIDAGSAVWPAQSMRIQAGPAAWPAQSMHIYAAPAAWPAQSMHIYAGKSRKLIKIMSEDVEFSKLLPPMLFQELGGTMREISIKVQGWGPP